MSNFLSISKSAANHIRKIMENGAGQALRIGLKKGGCAGMEYTMEYVNEISDADEIVEACRTVYDPEIPVNIYDLGLIYTVEISQENDAKILMSLTAPGCPVAGEMPGWVSDAIKTIEGLKSVHVEIVWEPQWGMEMMSDEARLELGFM